MARYLVVQVDDNARAEKLRERLEGVTGASVVGIFAKPTQFCECPVKSQKSVRGPKFHWWLCPECKRPKQGAIHHLKNLLDEPDLPAQFWNMMLWVKEPYVHPREQYGDAIDRVKNQIDLARIRLRGQARRVESRGRRRRKARATRSFVAAPTNSEGDES